jgi:hypothetical protein
MPSSPLLAVDTANAFFSSMVFSTWISVGESSTIKILAIYWFSHGKFHYNLAQCTTFHPPAFMFF